MTRLVRGNELGHRVESLLGQDRIEEFRLPARSLKSALSKWQKGRWLPANRRCPATEVQAGMTFPFQSFPIDPFQPGIRGAEREAAPMTSGRASAIILKSSPFLISAL